MNAPVKALVASPPLMTEREQYAAWAAEGRKDFLRDFPKAPADMVRDAGDAFAGLMMHRAKRHGRVFAVAPTDLRREM